jgi:hypothetical protein
MSKLSTAQRISIVGVILAFPLPFVVTRVWPASLAAIGLPFLYPIAIVCLAWSLAKTEARVGLMQRQVTVNAGLGLGAPPPTHLGARGIRTVTGLIAFIMAAACNPGLQHVFPRDGAFSDTLMVVHWVWWMATALFVGFVLPRFVPHDGSPP